MTPLTSNQTAILTRSLYSCFYIQPWRAEANNRFGCRYRLRRCGLQVSSLVSVQTIVSRSGLTHAVSLPHRSAIANQESLSILEVEMRKLEGVVKEITDEMDYLKRREERMRDTNGQSFAHQLLRLTMSLTRPGVVTRRV